MKKEGMKVKCCIGSVERIKSDKGRELPKLGRGSIDVRFRANAIRLRAFARNVRTSLGAEVKKFFYPFLRTAVLQQQIATVEQMKEQSRTEKRTRNETIKNHA